MSFSYRDRSGWVVGYCHHPAAPRSSRRKPDEGTLSSVSPMRCGSWVGRKVPGAQGDALPGVTTVLDRFLSHRTDPSLGACHTRPFYPPPFFPNQRACSDGFFGEPSSLPST